MVQHDRPDGRDCVKAHTSMSILDLGALLRKRDRDRREESPDQDPSNGDTVGVGGVPGGEAAGVGGVRGGEADSGGRLERGWR